MFTYIFRGMSAVLAVLYTVTALYLQHIPTGRSDTSAAILSSGEISEEEPVHKVKILQKYEDAGLLFQEALDLYSNINVYDIKFSVQTISTESDYHSALRAGLLSNDGINLFQISGAREFFELENHIRELDSFAWIKSACNGSLDAVSHNGHIYGIPYSIDSIGLIGNRYAFDEAEISPEKIRSLSDLDEAFSKINEQIVSGNSESLIGMESVTGFAVKDKDFLSTKLSEIALSGEFASATEAALAKTISFPAAGEAEELVKIMSKYSYYRSDWSKLAEITDAQQIESFANGRVAVILHDTGVYKRVNVINPDMRGKSLLLPIPLAIFEQPSVYTGVSSYWAVNAADSAYSATEAVGFLEWLYTSQEGSALFAEKFGEVSPFTDTAKDTGVSLHSQMLSYMSAGMSMPQFNREFQPHWGKDVFAVNVQSYFTEREKTWAEVIAACAAGWGD